MGSDGIFYEQVKHVIFLFFYHSYEYFQFHKRLTLTGISYFCLTFYLWSVNILFCLLYYVEKDILHRIAKHTYTHLHRYFNFFFIFL